MGLILPECIILHTQIPSTVILHTFSDFVDVFAAAEQSGLFLTEPDACNSLACPTKTLWRPFIAKFGPVNCRCHFYGGCALHCSLADWFSCVNIAAIHNEHLQKLQCYRISRLVQNRAVWCVFTVNSYRNCSAKESLDWSRTGKCAVELYEDVLDLSVTLQHSQICIGVIYVTDASLVNSIATLWLYSRDNLRWMLQAWSITDYW